MLHIDRGDFTSDDEREVLTVYTDAMHSIKTGPIYAKMTLPDRKQVKFQIDCGVTVNVIPAKHVDCSSIMDSHIQLRMYNNSALKPLGKCRLLLENSINGNNYRVEFQVV